MRNNILIIVPLDSQTLRWCRALAGEATFVQYLAPARSRSVTCSGRHPFFSQSSRRQRWWRVRRRRTLLHRLLPLPRLHPRPKLQRLQGGSRHHRASRSANSPPWRCAMAAWKLPNDNKVFGVGRTPEEVAAVLSANGQPTDKLALTIQPLLVKTAIACCCSTRERDRSSVRHLASSRRRSTEAGVDPQSVTDIFISHSHGDHVGGLVSAEGKLDFPERHDSSVEARVGVHVRATINTRRGFPFSRSPRSMRSRRAPSSFPAS